jgi:hypothetical protein
MPGGDLMDVLVAEAKVIKQRVPSASWHVACLAPKVSNRPSCWWQGLVDGVHFNEMTCPVGVAAGVSSHLRGAHGGGLHAAHMGIWLCAQSRVGVWTLSKLTWVMCRLVQGS